MFLAEATRKSALELGTEDLPAAVAGVGEPGTCGGDGARMQGFLLWPTLACGLSERQSGNTKPQGPGF